jgi:pilus assembly protein CpaC
VAAIPAILLLCAQARSWQFQPAPAIETGRMNVSPVVFRQPGPMPDMGKLPEKPAPKAAEKPGELPPPKGDGGPLADKPRLLRLGDGGFGATPTPTKEELKEYEKYVERFIDPRNTLDIVEKRTRLMILKQTPTKIQIADERIATADTLEPRQLSLQGMRVGTTVLNLTFEDPKDKSQKTLSYLVRVIPDPEDKARLERVYKALEKEINDLFCDSHVRISLVGDKIAVAGQAKDVYEGTQILRIVRANAPNDSRTIPVNSINVDYRPDPGNPNNATPGLADFLVAGGPNVINLLRVPGEQQVMLKVVVAEINRAAARSIGLNFNITNNNGVTVFSQRTGNIGLGGSGAVGTAGSGVGAGFGGFGGGLGGLALLGLVTNNLPVNLDGGQVSLAINALRELSYARSLAEPNLVAINGQRATFQAGGQFPVPVTAGLGGGGGFGGGGLGGGGIGILQGVNFVPYGVQLAFTPFIVDRDRIRLQVQADVSTRDIANGANIGGAGVPGLNTRNFVTTVELREGQTLAVAGLIQNNLGSQSDRVPGVGDIPILNRLFSYDRIQSGEQELVVLITPELVHPLEKKELLPLPGSDLLEPSDLEFYVCGRRESQKGVDYRASVRNSLGRMKAYHVLESVYVHGPAGFADGVPASVADLPAASGLMTPADAPPPMLPAPGPTSSAAPSTEASMGSLPTRAPVNVSTPAPARPVNMPQAPVQSLPATQAAPSVPVIVTPAKPSAAPAASSSMPSPGRMPPPAHILLPAEPVPEAVVRPYALPSPYSKSN